MPHDRIFLVRSSCRILGHFLKRISKLRKKKKQLLSRLFLSTLALRYFTRNILLQHLSCSFLNFLNYLCTYVVVHQNEGWTEKFQVVKTHYLLWVLKGWKCTCSLCYCWLFVFFAKSQMGIGEWKWQDDFFLLRISFLYLKCRYLFF